MVEKLEKALDAPQISRKMTFGCSVEVPIPHGLL